MTLSKEPKKKKANAVFEGGGVRGVGIAGALSVAGQHYDWAYVAGTSAGAIIAALVAAGYTSDEIRDKVFSLDYRRFEDTAGLGRIPIFGPALKLRSDLGIYKGGYIKQWIKENLQAKGIERFGDLVVNSNSKNPEGRYRLRVIASDISTGKMLVLPQDISAYGIEPDYLEVAEAIRMSISIPFFFEPVIINGPTTLPVKMGHPWKSHRKHNVSYIVDGGVLSNYPVWLFDSQTGKHSLPTFGFKLMGPNEGQPNQIDGPISMMKALFSTMMDAHDNRFIEERNFDRTIAIPTMGVKTTDFKISTEDLKALYQSGVNSAEQFFKHWDYHHFLTKHGL